MIGERPTGFSSIAEAMDVGATCCIDELAAELGWELRQDVQSNTSINMRKDGSVTLTLKLQLPAERVAAVLEVLRNANRPGLIEDIMRDAIGRLGSSPDQSEQITGQT